MVLIINSQSVTSSPEQPTPVALSRAKSSRRSLIENWTISQLWRLNSQLSERPGQSHPCQVDSDRKCNNYPGSTSKPQFSVKFRPKKHEFWVILALSLNFLKDIFHICPIVASLQPRHAPPLIWSLKCKRK